MSASPPGRILHVSRFLGGGAGRAACALHNGLLAQGIDSTIVTSTRGIPPGSPPRSITRPFPGGVAARLRRRVMGAMRRQMAPRPSGADPFDTGGAAYGRDFLARLPPHEILHLHGLAGYVDAAALLAAPGLRPCVWTLHDMHPFTGGCHYAGACEGYTRRCGGCPQLSRPWPWDLSRRAWRRRRAALRQRPPRRLHIVAPSRALAAACARSSLLGGFPITTIPYAVDTERFRPRDRGAARSALGLPPDRPVVMFAAHALGNPRKGGELLTAVWARLGPTAPLLLLAGNGDLPGPPPPTAVHLGALADDDRLALAYAAADLVVAPSREEGFGLVALEAQACAIPVVAGAVGGLTDAVDDGRTGLLLPPAADAEVWRSALTALLGDAARRAAMGRAARIRALAEFAIPVQARRHVALYDALGAGASTEGQRP